MEIGALGTVIDVEEPFIRGRFEYTEPLQLEVSFRSRFCVHPMFATVVDMADGGRGVGGRVVLPQGCVVHP